MIRDARRRKPAQTSEERMLHAVAEYLTERGWKILVISANRIQQQPDEVSNYEFVIKFTGADATTGKVLAL